MARNVKSTYKVQFPIRSESTAFDDIKGIDKSQYYLTFTGTPKEILNCNSKSGLIIATNDGAIEIETIQPEGKQKMPAKAYMNANKFTKGDLIENI